MLDHNLFRVALPIQLMPSSHNKHFLPNLEHATKHSTDGDKPEFFSTLLLRSRSYIIQSGTERLHFGDENRHSTFVITVYDVVSEDFHGCTDVGVCEYWTELLIS